MKRKEGIVTLTGTGTSQGVPVISCTCAGCRSDDPRDRRFRTSAHVSFETGAFMVDIGPDFRLQCLGNNIDRLDGIFVTHEHIDHVNGLDDIRPFNYIQKKVMPIYGEERVLNEIRKRNSYIFEPSTYAGLPMLELRNIEAFSPVDFQGMLVMPMRIMHDRLPILGYQFGNFAYVTDAKTFVPETVSILREMDTVVINALHHRKHHSHLNLEEALDFISENRLKKVYLTHISHQMGQYKEINQKLPGGVELAYDGLKINFRY
ncbi:MAG TPA: MBL fold metallo-hydrolase [Saprospiraceae bacterium]|nr:MBL fold metallo-hydrolase [Saprospiraceae bacterium]